MATENRSSNAVGNPQQHQFSRDIELNGERKTTAFTKPENHWALGPFPA